MTPFPTEPTIPEEPPTAPTPEPEARFPFWNYVDLTVVIALGLLAMILSQLLVMGAGQWFHLPKASQTLLAIPAQFIAYGLLFYLLHTLFRVLYGQPMMKSLAWVRSRLTVPNAILIGLLLSVIVALLGTALKMPNEDTPMKQVLANPTGLVLIALFGTTVGPLCEELIFRGFLQPLLVRTFGVVIGIFLTALPFGLLHLQQYGNAWQSGVLITLVGVVLGAVRHFTNSTRASTYVHAAYNSSLFLALLVSGKALSSKW
jgi:membrane protease YdiL (CAAX protease family)